MTKKQPQRTCMGCNQKKDKKELLRIVKNKEGKVLGLEEQRYEFDRS